MNTMLHAEYNNPIVAQYEIIKRTNIRYTILHSDESHSGQRALFLFLRPTTHNQSGLIENSFSLVALPIKASSRKIELIESSVL